jgi:hypothetical protein
VGLVAGVVYRPARNLPISQALLVSEVSVSLKGSLETIALAEVLHLLADTAKSGELHVQGVRGEGRLWFDAGALSGFSVGTSYEPADAVFELLRIDSGEFSFDSEAVRPDDVAQPELAHRDIGPELEVAQGRFAEWSEILEVVPSLGHSMSLAAEAPDDTVLVDRSQWGLLVAIGDGHSVGEILSARGLSEFDGSRALKGLIEGGLATIAEPETVVEVPAIEEQSSPYEAPAMYSDSMYTDSVYSDAVTSEEAPTSEEAVTSEEKAAGDSAADGFEDTSYGYHRNGDHAKYAFGGWNATSEDEVAVGALDGDAPIDSDSEEVTVEEASVEDSDSEVVPEADPTGREALRALLAEVTSQAASEAEAEAAHAEDTSEADHSDLAVDGLSDRGPWTSDELHEIGGWTDHEGTPEHSAFESLNGHDTVHDAADDGHHEITEHETVGEVHGADESELESEADAEEEEPSEEPINRGLLLKFLSSVRN